MIRSLRPTAMLMLLLSLLTSDVWAQGTSTNLFFADGQIQCEVVSSRAPIPEPILVVLPIAMKTALTQVGPPVEPALLTIHLLPPPPFYQRVRALFRVEVSASQQGDEIQLQADDDPLKLAFRIGHELSHWLVAKRYPVRPPLWLDEGLAQVVAAAAAETCARTQKQSLERPRPPKLDRNLYSLDELIALQAYPQTADRSAAFYWQAEALVHALRERLGLVEFTVYLGILSSPSPPAWQAPLRERWYFSDWDFNWLAQQIQPDSKSE